jgi:predicted Rossmann fold nucleotide-binding protein DprA/Smf involved in DNA uptake
MQTNIVAALTSHLLDDAEPVGASIWRSLRDSDGDVIEWSRKNLSVADAEKVELALSRVDDIDDALARLAEMGIIAISEFDEDYPQRIVQRLGGKRPPLLFVAGNASLLNGRSLGIVGSRDVDETGAVFAAEAAHVAVEHGYIVVSGGAKGVDQASMQAAFESGGESLGFLSDSLEKTVRGSADALESGRVCLASAVSPKAGFNVANAMNRNKLIYAHSDATLVVSSAFGAGGTWAGADEALKLRYCQVIVRDGEDVPDGNKELIKRGGIPIRDPREIVGAIDAPIPGTLF